MISVNLASGARLCTEVGKVGSRIASLSLPSVSQPGLWLLND